MCKICFFDRDLSSASRRISAASVFSAELAFEFTDAIFHLPDDLVAGDVIVL